MLFDCIECGKKISDKAKFCPHCGMPYENTPKKTIAPKKPPQRNRTNYRRLPNGFGTIKKLSGNRANPYAVYPPTIGYYDNGSPLPRKALGYFKTWNEGYQALAIYNKEKENKGTRITFEYVFELFYEDMCSVEEPKNSKSYRTGLGHCKTIAKEDITDLKTIDYQKVIDSCKTYGASGACAKTIKAVTRFAWQNDWVEKDYGQFVRNKMKHEVEKGVPFYDEELKKIWERRGDTRIQMILIMIFTGFRISEYETITLDMDEWTLKGGLKTDAGKNRIVPIHDVIKPFFRKDMFDNFSALKFRRSFNKALEDYGLKMSVSNTIHTPHDTRHTFSWIGDKFGISTVAKHMLMGHLSGDVEIDTYGHATIDELRAEIAKIQPKQLLEYEVND